MPRVLWSCDCGYTIDTTFEGRGQGFAYLFRDVPEYARPDPCPRCGSDLLTAWICGDCGGSTQAHWAPDRCNSCGLTGTMSLLRTDNPAGCMQVAVACADNALRLTANIGLLIALGVWTFLRLT